MTDSHTLDWSKRLIAVAILAAIAVALPQWSSGPAPAYRIAAQLVRSGQFDGRVYDDRWFGAQVSAATNHAVSDIFWPSPPSLLLFLWPIGFVPDSILPIVWAIVNGLALLLAAYLMLSVLKRSSPRTDWLLAPTVILTVVSAPMQEDLSRGQIYVFILLLHAIAFWAIMNQRDRIAGFALALLIALKVNGWPVWIILIALRRWRILKWAAASAIILVLISLPMVGVDSWREYLTQIFSPRTFSPIAAVTAYQTIGGFFQHFFRYDAAWNPAPLIDGPWLALLGSIGITIGLLAITWIRSSRISIEQTLGAAIVLSAILSPLAEQYHFLILSVPLIILAVDLDRMSWARRGLLILTIGLVAVALPYKSPKLSGGLISLLAYPRLASALIVWAMLCWSSVTTNREPLHA